MGFGGHKDPLRRGHLRGLDSHARTRTENAAPRLDDEFVEWPADAEGDVVARGTRVRGEEAPDRSHADDGYRCH